MMQISDIHNIFLSCKKIVIDTRKIEENSFFVAIKGDRFDANTFANEALEKGATFVLIDNDKYYIDSRTILVKNTLETLQELATYHRKYLNIPIIALTGSNGKTTTKELIQMVLSKKFKANATFGNLNNHIGVPLTLLSFNKNTEIGIVEMGANHQKEIEFLCNIAQPDYGYITNFGKAHLEGFGGVEGVIKGKSEMYDYLKANNKKVFVNLDDAIQQEKTIGMNQITFSTNNSKASTIIQHVAANPFVTITFDNINIKSNLIGLYNATNVSIAITIGQYFNISTELIKNAIQEYTPDNNRSQLLSKGTNNIILDAYNANPSSMKVAIENFIQLEANNKFILLGDMFELGELSNEEHSTIIKQLQKNTEIKTIFVGNYFFNNQLQESHFQFFKSFEEASDYLIKNPIQNANILIKGSRGMQLERALEILE